MHGESRFSMWISIWDVQTTDNIHSRVFVYVACILSISFGKICFIFMLFFFAPFLSVISMIENRCKAWDGKKRCDFNIFCVIKNTKNNRSNIYAAYVLSILCLWSFNNSRKKRRQRYSTINITVYQTYFFIVSLKFPNKREKCAPDRDKCRSRCLVDGSITLIDKIVHAFEYCVHKWNLMWAIQPCAEHILIDLVRIEKIPIFCMCLSSHWLVSLEFTFRSGITIFETQ